MADYDNIIDPKLRAALIAEDEAEDRGVRTVDRRTCHVCRVWATPEHYDSAEHEALYDLSAFAEDD